MDRRLAVELCRSLRERLPNFKHVASKQDIKALDVLIAWADEKQTTLDVQQDTKVEE